MPKTPPQYSPNDRDQKLIRTVLDCVTEGKRWHNEFARKVERRYEAWRGMLPENQPQSTGWRSQQHPPYLINIVEGMLSSIQEENPIWNVHPRAIPDMEMDEAIAYSRNAQMSSYLLTHQMRIDDFGFKGGTLAHQDLIAGLTVGKVFWLTQDIKRRYFDETASPIYDEAGGTIDIARKLDQFEEVRRIRDDPTLEVRDVRDWMYPESAKSLESSPWVIDRTYVTYKTLERMEEMKIYKNVKFVKETRYDESNASTDPERGRERRLRNVDRTRGLVEIVEHWTDEFVTTIANGSVLLRHAPNPFAHGRKPFVVCSAIPDLFQIPGVSVIEGLASMQELLWTLMNTRIDATKVAASVITMIVGDVDDPEQYEFAPEAQWIIPYKEAVQTLDMSAAAAAAQSTLQSEGLLRGDIQNVMGGLPFTGSAQSQNLPTDTATGVSIVTNIAQAILARRKGMHQRMYSQVGQMFLELDQQFIQEDRLVQVFGAEGERHFMDVGWQDIEGIFDVELEVTGDSMLRQERRAESGALLTEAIQSAGVMGQTGDPLNLRRFWEKHLDSYGITDKATYFMQKPAQGQQQPQGGMGTPQQADTAQQNASGQLDTGGITNSSLAAGPTAPSSPVSMSAAAPMQQALAKNGAGRSV